MVDGSGVLYDPEGIDRTHLNSLASSRLPVMHYKGPFSNLGYLVKINDTNVTLPSGEKIQNGMIFRNEFHLREDVQADFFVPCGGRPEAINISNVDSMFLANGKPRFFIFVYFFKSLMY